MRTPFIIIAVVFLVIVIGVAIVVFRIRKEMQARVQKEKEEHPEEEEVEYEWVFKPSMKSRIIAFALFALMIAAYFIFGETDESGSKISQTILLMIGSIIGIFTAQGTVTYRITASSLFYKKGTKEKTEFKRLFLWSDLLWVKPEDDGFRYYLRERPKAELVSVSGSIGRKGRIRCGKDAMMINSFVLAKGVPVKPVE